MPPGAPPPQLAASESGTRGLLRPASFPPPFGACHPCRVPDTGPLDEGRARGPPAGETRPRHSAGLGARARAREPGRGAEMQTPRPDAFFFPRRRIFPHPGLSCPPPPALALGALGIHGQGKHHVWLGGGTTPIHWLWPSGYMGEGPGPKAGGWVEPFSSDWLQPGSSAEEGASPTPLTEPRSRPRCGPERHCGSAGTLWAGFSVPVRALPGRS